MSAKSASPEEAQRKLWKLEIRDLEKAGNKVRTDFRKARRDAEKIAAPSIREGRKAQSQLLRTIARLEKKEPATLKRINARIAQLKGRL